MTRLEAQLRQAEREQQRRRPMGRAKAAIRTRRPSAPVAAAFAAAAALVIAVVVGAVALTRGGDEQTVGREDSGVIARTVLGDAPFGSETAIANGFGSVWIGGYDRKQIMRVDPAGRRVLARVPVPRPLDGLMGVVTAGGAVWALSVSNVDSEQFRLALNRIDPATNRVVRRTALGAEASTVTAAVAGAGTTPLANGSAMWAVGSEGGALIDPRSGTVSRIVTWNLGGVFADSYALSDTDLWVHAADGRVLRLDARTGRREASFPGAPGLATRLEAIPGGAGVLVGRDDGTVTRIDGASGRELWSTRLGEGIGQLVIVDRVLWAGNRTAGLERLTPVDLDTGRPLRKPIELGEPNRDFGYAIARVGSELWVTTPAGELLVVRP